MARLAEADCIVICVPTPLNESRDPDLSYIEGTAESIAKTLRPGQLIVLESTTHPTTTRTTVLPVLERTGLSCGRDYFLAFSPEREDPGNPTFHAATIPKVVGGFDDVSGDLACAMYGNAVVKVVRVSSMEVAEASKILENTYRAVNIALVNELAMLADRMDIDIWESIEAAATKPFGFMPFWPGPGLGGHCIPIDPFYLAWRARAFDLDSEFVELAGRVNVRMPYYATSRIARALNGRGTAVQGARVLLLGMAYKSDVGDLRESPSLKLLELLRAEGAEVTYHDPHVPELSDEGLSSVELDAGALAEADCVVVATAHKAIDLAFVVEHARLVVDLRNGVRQRLAGRASGGVPDNVDVL
jgi:UDP-N-acetyl-D-glucosamine dehydrogenase